MDHPGVRCENCEDIERIDGIVAPCKETACPMPPISPQEARLLEMRWFLASLSTVPGLSGGSVLKIYGATVDDLKILAEVEQQLSAHSMKTRKEV